MKLKKICAVFLSVVLSGALFVGCGKIAVLRIATVGDVTSAAAGGSIEIVATVADGKASGDIVFKIKSGAEQAVLTNDGENKATLTMRPTATPGSEVVVCANDAKATSNEITVTVQAIPVSSIALTSGAADRVLRKEVIVFTADILPEGASANGLEYLIIAGEEYAEITGDGKITVKGNAPVGGVIKVVAKIGGITSNECTFTVDEDADTKFEISLSADNLKLDIFNPDKPNLTAMVIDADGKVIRDASVAYTVSRGAEFVSVENVNNAGILTQTGHGSAVVTARVVGTNAVAECAVKSVVPPDAINMPANLPQLKETKFAYSRADDLLFAPVILGTKVCTDFKVEFKRNGAPSAEAATYNKETNKITFAPATVGAVEVIVTSTSGSVKETSFTREVLVNDGTNIETMAEFLAVMNNYNHQSEASYKSVNLLNNIIGMDGAAEELQTLPALMSHAATSFGDRYIYGNNYLIDLSNLIIPEYNEWFSAGGKSFPDFLNFKGYSVSDVGGYASNAKLYTVEIYDLDFKGNVETFTPYSPVDGVTDGSDSPVNRAYRRAIIIDPLRPRIDDDHNESTPTVLVKEGSQVCKNLIMQNISVNGFYFCTTFMGVVNGKVTDCSFGNSFGSSLDMSFCDITFKDIDFQRAGIASIEVSSDKAEESGENFTEKQTVRFEGKLTSKNMNDGRTPVLINDEDLKNLMPVALANLDGSLVGQKISDTQISNVLRTEGTGDDAKASFNWLIYVQGDGAKEYSNIIFTAGTLADYFKDFNGTSADYVYEYAQLNVSYMGNALGTIYTFNLNHPNYPKSI